MKILSLAIGLALGVVLIAKAAFEQNYDGFYEDSGRIHLILEAFPSRTESSLPEIYPTTPGGVAVYLRMLSPEIETSTRFTSLGEGSTFTLTESKDKLKATYAAADSCFFDVLSVDVLQGDPKEILSRPLYAMVSESIAGNIGEDAVGKTIVLDGKEDAVLTIGGIFRDFPENSVFSHLDMLVSMPSISCYTWDGSMNLIGNDRYTSLIKLKEGADIADVQAQTDRFIQDNFSQMMEESGIEFGLTFRRLDSWHASAPQTRNMTLLIVFIGLVGYTSDEVSRRRKELAIRKINGAMMRDIAGLMNADVIRIALPSVIIGAVAAFFVSEGWLEQFAAKAPLGWYLFAGGALVVLALSLAVATYNVIRIAGEDPVKSLKTE